MKKLILAFFFLLAGAVNALAQSTTVTSTVTDSGGVAWIGGTYSFTFVGPTQVNWPGGTVTRVVNGTLDGTGSFSQSLPDNNTITPSPTGWTLQVCPLLGVQQSCFTLTNLKITGATLALTVTPPAIQVIGSSSFPIVAYADAEVVAPVPKGLIYYRASGPTTGTYRQCDVVNASNACTSWSNIGGAAAGVASLNSITGAVNLLAGTGITVTPAGQNITIAATGGGTITGSGVANQVTFWTGASAIGGNVALTFDPVATVFQQSQAGTFNNSAAVSNTHRIALLGGNASCPDQLIIGGAFITNALEGCVNIPTSGVTNGFSVGVTGLVNNANPNSTGQFGRVEGVGVYGVARCAANNTVCIGVAPQVQSTAGLSGVSLEGSEIDVSPLNATDSGMGLLVVYASTTQASSLTAIDIFAPNAPTGAWSHGILCRDFAISLAAQDCLSIGKARSTGNTGSQQILWHNAPLGVAKTDAQSLFADDVMGFDTRGMVIGVNTGVGKTGGYAATFSVGTVSQNQLVKIDSTANDAVTLCTTTDTMCDGFIAGTNDAALGLCSINSNFCPVFTVPGSKVVGILGSGTCARGNFVIVDTVTNGDVKCTATEPPINALMGIALSAQSTVGQTVDLIFKPRQRTALPLHLSYADPTLTVSAAGFGNGQVTFSGNTSGTCTETVNATSTTLTDSCTRVVPAGSAGTPSLSFVGQPGSGFFLDGAASVNITRQTTTILTLQNSGPNAPFGLVFSINSDTGWSRLAAGSFAIGNGTNGDVSGKLTSGTYATGTNCASSGGTCGSAAAGRVTIAAAATTVTVATTAVTANSEIFIQEDSTLGAALGVTCNTTIARSYVPTTRTAGTSFVITSSAAPAANPACLSYKIIN